MKALIVLIRRRSILLIGFLAIVGVPLVLILTRIDSITPANYDKIQKRMTEEEVVALLGRPADEIEMFGSVSMDEHGEIYYGQVPGFRNWHGNRGSIRIHFGSEGELYKEYLPNTKSWQQRFREWLTKRFGI